MKKLLKRTVLHENRLFTVSENRLIDPAGHKIDRILVEHQGSTVALPTDGNGNVLLVRQYRFPARAYMWELPAGKIDPGESALQAAKRELIEETGYRAKRWKKLTTFYPSPGFHGEWMSIFLAENLVAGEREVIEDEHLEIKWFSVAWVEQQIRRGKIFDAKTIIGMCLWRNAT
ncbi:MAG: NUDIX hydrolase [Acidobacteria bacterium]|nr:NUDIX hydrolase [Acidobacteriota bacterium]